MQVWEWCTYNMELSAVQPIAIQSLYSELKDRTMQEPQAFLGAPGTINQRSNQGGHAFWAHMRSSLSGKRAVDYLGSVNDPAAQARKQALEERIARAKMAIELIRLLSNAGYSLLDPKTYAVLASLANAGVFQAGAVLVGSHAYGVILADRGIRAAPYRTEDIDLAKGARLVLAGSPLQLSLKAQLQATDLDFVEVPGLQPGTPAVSLKEPGVGGLRIDLLVPGSDQSFRPVAVPELDFHATAVPFLGYLLEQPVSGLVIGRYGACLVNTPSAERFALHKLVTAADRRGRQDKIDKDVFQACVLLNALSRQDFYGVLLARDDMPEAMRGHLQAGLRMARRSHPAALSGEDWELLEEA